MSGVFFKKAEWMSQWIFVGDFKKVVHGPIGNQAPDIAKRADHHRADFRAGQNGDVARVDPDARQIHPAVGHRQTNARRYLSTSPARESDFSRCRRPPGLRHESASRWF